MKELFSRASAVALFYGQKPVPVKVPTLIPSDWDKRYFPEDQLFIRALTADEKKLLWKRFLPTGAFDWDEIWYGAFRIGASVPSFACDSKLLLKQKINKSSAVKIYIN